MANLRIGYINCADAATLSTAATYGSTTPLSYLQNDSRGYMAQASSSAGHFIYGTWGGTAYSVAQMALWRANLVYNDLIRFILYSDAAWTTIVYDTGPVAAYASGLFDNWGWSFVNWYFTAISVKSFAVGITAAAPFQASRLYLGPYTEATYNPNYGLTLGIETNSKQSRSESGSLQSIPKAWFRSMGFDMSIKTEADRAAWMEISRYCLTHKSFIASLNPGVGGTSERDGTIFGKFERSFGHKFAGPTQYDQSVKILEI